MVSTTTAPISFFSPLLHVPSDNGANIPSKHTSYPHQQAIANLIQDAVAALNTLQSNFAVVDAIRKSGRKMNEQAIPEMVDWLRKIGYQVCKSEGDMLLERPKEADKDHAAI